MEYLMTYGWAIIIVIIVGLMLWRLGVFSPCVTGTTGFTEFSPEDYKIDDNGTAAVTLLNKDPQSREITMVSATVEDQACTGDTGSQGAGETWTLSCTGLTSGASGTCYTGIEVSVEYTVAGYNHTETGKISGKYE